MVTEVTKVLADIGYAVRMTPANLDHRGVAYKATFVVLLIAGVEESGNILWQLAGSTTSPDPVEDIEKAEWYARGDVKWDGCVNYEVQQDGVMLHECGLNGFEKHYRLWQAIYEMARDAMPATAYW